MQLIDKYFWFQNINQNILLPVIYIDINSRSLAWVVV